MFVVILTLKTQGGEFHFAHYEVFTDYAVAKAFGDAQPVDSVQIVEVP